MSNHKLTEKEKGMVIENIGYIINYVTRNFTDATNNQKEELISHAHYSICKKIKNFDRARGTFTVFITNVLTYDLNNYFVRDLKNYRIVSKKNLMNEEHQEKIEVSEKEHGEAMELFRNGEIETEPLYKMPQLWEPVILNNIDSMTEDDKISVELITIDRTDKSEDYDVRLRLVKNILTSFKPVQRIFADRVFFKGENPNDVSKEINATINKLHLHSQKREHFYLDNGLGRESFKLEMDKAKDIIAKEFYLSIIQTNKPIDEIKADYYLSHGMYEKGKIITAIKRKLNYISREA